MTRTKRRKNLYGRRSSETGNLSCSETKSTSKCGSEKRKPPPDPDGLFAECARMAEKVIAMYDRLNPGCGDESLVGNLLHDLMHLCDREPKLGGFDEGYELAIYLYDDLTEKSRRMAETSNFP